MGRSLLLVWSLSFGADGASTQYALNHGAHEIMLPSQNPYAIDAMLVGEAALSWWALSKISPKHPKIAKTIYWVAVGVHTGAAINNLGVR